MKKLSVLLLVLVLFACQTKQEQFTNPILAGFYPDPSICKVGEYYYLVTSTFVYYPGIPVFRSKDLVNWKLISYVIHKPEILNVEGSRVSRGLFAPSIRYHEGLFYVSCTLVDRGGNFISTSADPEKGWNDPVWFPQVNGIDPSPFFDEDGRAYLVYNSIAPDDAPLYDGHRTIRIIEFSKYSLKAIGEESILINGGTDLDKKPVWIEAPHIFKKDGYYYLIAAEGGTAYQHSEVVFRSKSLKGPYVSYEKNPILTQRHLDPNRPDPITTTGHADFVETDKGEWWAVFLGCRPYVDKDYYNNGRETFLAPVKWIDGWPVINPDFETVQYTYDYPLPKVETDARPQSGNFVFKDDFNTNQLALEWMFLRAPKSPWYSLSDKTGSLTLQVRPEQCKDYVNPSFIGHRQQHLNSAVSTSINFAAEKENEKAGLLIFQNEEHFYFLCKSIMNGEPVVQLYQSTVRDSSMNLLTSKTLDRSVNDLQLKIESKGDQYIFYYATQQGEWISMDQILDAKFLSTQVAGGFVGCIYAMYATSLGEESQAKASFDWFEYAGNDDVYKPKP
jgi:alpha-N-arabinofuranosidase